MQCTSIGDQVTAKFVRSACETCTSIAPIEQQQGTQPNWSPNWFPTISMCTVLAAFHTHAHTHIYNTGIHTTVVDIRNLHFHRVVFLSIFDCIQSVLSLRHSSRRSFYKVFRGGAICVWFIFSECVCFFLNVCASCMCWLAKNVSIRPIEADALYSETALRPILCFCFVSISHY